MISAGFSGSAARQSGVARLLIVGAGLAGFFAVPHAQAQAVQPQAVQAAPAPANTHCTLHVWPAETTHSTYFGWGHGGAVDGNRRGIKGYPETFADVLDTAGQARLLAQVDWPAQTGDAGLQVAIHPAPTGSEDDRARAVPLIADAGPCYQELIITSSLVEMNVLSSRSVRVVGLRKTFAGPGVPPTNFSAMSMAKIVVPEKSGPDFDEKMRAATAAAFLVAVKKFVIMQSFH